MAAKDEPSNPFKNPRKSPTSTNNRSPQKGHRTSPIRSKSEPPTPPGRQQSKPEPLPPSGTESTDSGPVSKTPARAGKSVGLRKKSEKVKVKTETKTDQKARELIEASLSKVVEKQPMKQDIQPAASKEPYNPFKKNLKKRVAPAPRRGGRFGKRNKPQGPSKRIKKLHRGKYMEFKYDVRRILEEEDVDDEYRSNVLGQTWAKGERQGVSEAKTFLDEKVAEGIISEDCSSKIMKLIDSLTTRR